MHVYIQIYEVQEPGEAEAVIGLGVDHKGVKTVCIYRMT